MPRTDDILSTLRMVKQGNLDRPHGDNRDQPRRLRQETAVTSAAPAYLIARTIRTTANKLKETCATATLVPLRHPCIVNRPGLSVDADRADRRRLRSRRHGPHRESAR